MSQGGEPLAKHRKGAYKKGERRFLQRTGTDAGMARVRPPQVYGCQLEVTFFDPGPSLLGRGQLLLVGVGRRQQDKGHSDKQDETTSPHGGTLLFRLCHTGHVVKGGSRTREGL